jgi:hypothetical protein
MQAVGCNNLLSMKIRETSPILWIQIGRENQKSKHQNQKIKKNKKCKKQE